MMFMEDKEIILALGGPTKVAELLGLDKSHGGPQRVQNWMKRGIPAKVKIAHPDLFLQELLTEKAKSSKYSGFERRKGRERRTSTKSG